DSPTCKPDNLCVHFEHKFKYKEDEEAHKQQVLALKNKPLTEATKRELFADRFRYVRTYFDAIEEANILPTVQDDYLMALCTPERLLDFAFNFVLYDTGEKKIARYQQYYAIKKTMHQITKLEYGKRKGGVIWHTQGSGKSLTMVMLAQAIVME